MPLRRGAWAYQLLLVGLVLTCAAIPARADIALDKTIVDFVDPRERRSDITIFNPTDETMYVVVEPAEIVAPGTPEQRRVPIVDPRAGGLLVTPGRLVLEPGAHRLVRLLRLGPPGQQERIYRVKISPVAGGLAGQGIAVRVLFGFDALVMVRPSQPVTQLVGVRTGKHLVLENKGNTNTILFDGRQCDSAGNNCRELPADRLYAGNRRTIDLPYDAPVIFRYQSLDSLQELHF